MDLANFNNEIVKCKKPIKNAKVFTIRKITSRIKSLKKKKGSEQQLQKNSRKCDRFVQEINIIKSVKVNAVILFVLENDELIEKKLKQSNNSVEERALLMLAQCQITRKAVETLKERVPEWKKLVIQFQARAERRKKWKERQQVIEELDQKFDKYVNKEKQEDGSQDGKEGTEEDKADQDASEEETDDNDDDDEEEKGGDDDGEEKDGDDDEEEMDDDDDNDEEEEEEKGDNSEEEGDSDSTSDGENQEDEDDLSADIVKADDTKPIEPVRAPAVHSIPKKTPVAQKKVEKAIIRNINPSPVPSKIVPPKVDDKPSQPAKKLQNLPEKDSEMSVRQLDLTNLDESITIDSLSKDDSNDLQPQRKVTKESPQVKKKRDRFFLGGSGSDDDSEEDAPDDFDNWGRESEAPRFPYREDRGGFSRPFSSRGSYRGYSDRQFSGGSDRQFRGGYDRAFRGASDRPFRGESNREFRGESSEFRDSKPPVPEQPKAHESEKLHPSWAAKKKLKGDNVESAPCGKKITFDD